MMPLPWLLFAHLLADYPLQGTYLAETKGHNPHSLFAHAGIWTGCIILATQAIGRAVRPADGLLLLLVHTGLDLAKARRVGPYARLGPLAGLTLDQGLHVIQLLVLLVRTGEDA